MRLYAGGVRHALHPSSNSCKPMEVGEVYFLRAEDGKLVDFWGLEDDLAKLQQLGLIPSPEQSEEASPT